MRIPRRFPKEIAAALRRGGVGVIPTDTIYGIVGSALDRRAVDRIYRLRKRSRSKPFIILISSPSAVGRFGPRLDRYRRAFLKEAWPGPVSVILRVPGPEFRYLHRGTRSLAFRVPADDGLRELLKRTGPLVAPSANWEGHPPAKSIKEAQGFFGAGADFYVDGGIGAGKPSTLIALTGESPEVLRP